MNARKKRTLKIVENGDLFSLVSIKVIIGDSYKPDKLVVKEYEFIYHGERQGEEMKKPRSLLIILLTGVVIAGCIPGVIPTLVSIPTNTITPVGITVYPTSTSGAIPSETPVPSATPPSYPAQGMGPSGFPSNVDPLTGLTVEDPSLLIRRPVAIKVENIPRGDRPPWGLTNADIIYEYYTEEGATRFIAVFYGENSDKVGPIRSGRFFDANVVQMYKSIFIFGYAWQPEFEFFVNSDFGKRLVLESDYTKPTLFRTTGEGNYDLLFANLKTLPSLLSLLNIDNSQQNLDGMFFNTQFTGTSQLANSVTIRFSSVIYNRWDYNSSTGLYMRSVDTITAQQVSDEKYTVLTDRNNGKPITAANVVVLYAPYNIYVRTATSEVYQIPLSGVGPAYLVRDGQIYQLTWHRNSFTDLLTLEDANGNLFPLKPGNTWFEVIHNASDLTQPAADTWRFTLHLP